MKLFLGIDPGLTGGLAYLPGNNASVLKYTSENNPPIISRGIFKSPNGAFCSSGFASSLTYEPMPLVNGAIEARAVAETIRRVTRDYLNVKAFVEKTQAAPGQGVTSMHSFGIGAGIILGVLAALDIPTELVVPSVWTRVMHRGSQGATPKERSRETALRLFPGHTFLATSRSRKPHEGIIDAVLIAEYGRRLTMGRDHGRVSEK